VTSSRLVCLLVLLIACSVGLYADTYSQTTFTGGVLWPHVGNAFDGLDSVNATVSGTFITDDSLNPGSGSGFYNVGFPLYPDIGLIPPGTAFSISVGPNISFTLADDITGFPAVQYHDGAFNGFSFSAQFQFNGNTYEFDDQGSVWTIYDAPGGVNNFHQEAYGYIGGITSSTPYTPPPPATAPEPASLVLIVPGLTGAMALRRRMLK